MKMHISDYYINVDFVDLELCRLLHNIAHNVYSTMGERWRLPAFCIV